jgi:hypothetical protein
MKEKKMEEYDPELGIFIGVEKKMETDWLIQKNFIRHSGSPADFKIECDALTDTEIETFAYLIHKRFRFRSVLGVPRGGLRIAEALMQWREIDDSLPPLIVDDVGTTGASMESFHKDCKFISGETINVVYGNKCIGVVLFWVGKDVAPSWIHPIFTMWKN